MRPTVLCAATLMLAACGQAEPANAVAANDLGYAMPSTPAPAPLPTEAAEATANGAVAVQSTDDSNGGVGTVLSGILTSVGQLNGAKITAVRQSARCTTIVSSGGSDATIDWTKVPDWLSRNHGGRVVIPIVSGGKTYTFSVPQAKQPEPVGDAGATVEGAFGSLADSCAA